MSFDHVSRRGFLRFSAALAGAAAVPGVSLAGSHAPLTVGFIYAGPKDDFGYNQAHAEGAAAA